MTYWALKAAAAVMLCGALTGPPATAHASAYEAATKYAKNAPSEQELCEALSFPVTNLRNDTTGTSLLTTSKSESKKAIAKRNFEPTADNFAASKTPREGLVELTRAYSGKRNDFAWTPLPALRGYTLQKVDFFASPTPLACTVPVYEFQRYRHHLYVWSADHAAELEDDGWERGNIAFHAVPLGHGEPLDVSVATTDVTQDKVLCEALTEPVHHLRRAEEGGTDLLTPSEVEAHKAQETYRFDTHAEPLRASTQSAKGLTALYRYYSSKFKDFRWSTDAVDETHELQKSDFFVADAPLSCTVPVLEFTKDGIHRYAWSKEETAELYEQEWSLVRVAFHAVPGSNAEPAENPGVVGTSEDDKGPQAAMPRDVLRPLMPRATILMMLR